MTPTRGWAVVALQAFVLGLFAWHAALVRYVEDDAYISFRYAQHLVQGSGLVYNVGERVEGYSNFLWVVLLAGASRVWPSVGVPAVAAAFGLLAAGAVILLGLNLPLIGRDAASTRALAGLLLAAHSGFVAWSTAGLETTTFALLLLAGAISVGRHLSGGRGLAWGALWFVLAALTRADGALFFAATFVFVAIVDLKRQGRAGVPALLGFAAFFAALYVPYLAWRFAYYGDLLPNTAYAKGGGGWPQIIRGVQYVGGYVLDYGVWLWLPAVALCLYRLRESWIWYFVTLIATDILYVVYVGGDSLGFHRFLVHVAPLMAVVAAVALVDVDRRFVRTLGNPSARLAVRALGVAIVVAMTARSTLVPVFFPDRARWFEPQAELSFPGRGTDHSYLWFNNYFVDRLKIAAEYLDKNAPAGALVASTPAGAIAYYMDHPVIDMLGLTDAHIARTTELYRGMWTYGRAGHEKGDGRYVLSRAPDYILMGNVAVLPFPLDDERMAGKLVFKSEHELWADPEFHARYELVSVRLAKSGPFQYFTFYRRRAGL